MSILVCLLYFLHHCSNVFSLWFQSFHSMSVLRKAPLVSPQSSQNLHSLKKNKRRSGPARREKSMRLTPLSWLKVIVKMITVSLNWKESLGYLHSTLMWLRVRILKEVNVLCNSPLLWEVMSLQNLQQASQVEMHFGNTQEYTHTHIYHI